MDEPITLAFVGHADAASVGAAAAYEDAVLALLHEHEGRLLYRGRRRPDQAEGLPAEVHLIRFPSRDAYEAYLDDPRRLVLMEAHGEVFAHRLVVELDTVVGPEPP